MTVILVFSGFCLFRNFDNLASFVVAAFRAGGMGGDFGTALRAGGKFGCAPSIGRFAGAEAHFRGFTFRDSHNECEELVVFGFELVEDVPEGRPFRVGAGFVIRPGSLRRQACWTRLFHPRITFGIRRKGKENIFPDPLGQVHRFFSVERGLDGEIGDLD